MELSARFGVYQAMLAMNREGLGNKIKKPMKEGEREKEKEEKREIKGEGDRDKVRGKAVDVLLRLTMGHRWPGSHAEAQRGSTFDFPILFKIGVVL